MDAVAPISAWGSGLLFSQFWSGFWNPQTLQGSSPHGGRLLPSFLAVNSNCITVLWVFSYVYWKMKKMNWMELVISVSIIINYVIYTAEQQNSNGTFIFMRAACNFIVPSLISNIYICSQTSYNIATLITVFLGAWFANEMRNDDSPNSNKSCLLYNNAVLHALISIWLSLLLYANGLETKLQIWQQMITT